MSSFSGISRETQTILDTIGSSMPPSSIEQLWDCIHWWCACGKFQTRSHFLEIVFWKLFREFERRFCHMGFSPVFCSSSSLMFGRIGATITFNVWHEQLLQRMQQREYRLHYQRYKQWRPQPQLRWLQPQGHQHLPQNLPQQQGESPQPMEELLILACQLLTALPDDDTLMRDLVDGIVCAYLWGAPIEKAASCLSTDRLNRISRELEDDTKLRDFRAAALKKIARERSLQDLCVLSTLEAVKGDAKKVWSLSELPEPLKELFHVPFLALYNKLRQ